MFTSVQCAVCKRGITFSIFCALLLCCMVEGSKWSRVILMPNCVLVHKPDASEPQEGCQVAKDLERGEGGREGDEEREMEE